MTDRPLRLSHLNADPAAALQVVAFFDRLEEAGANAELLLRSAAILSECPVGARWASGTTIRYNALGSQEPTDSEALPHPGDTEPAVWLERADTDQPLDAVVLDRLRRLLRAIAGSTGVAPRLGDPALVEVVLSSKENPEDRARAIRLLGLDESRDVRVLAVSAQSPPEALKLVLAALSGLRVRTAAIGHTMAVLCQGANDTRELSEGLNRDVVTAFPAPLPEGADRGPWIGIGANTGVFTAATSWREALRALRFASSTGYGRRVIAYERLSVLELLADLPLDRVHRNPDVRRVNELAATPAGALEVGTVEAFFVFGSLRRTAEELHVHHSTVASRLANVTARMGWDFDDPMDRFMATLVFMVRRIALSATELADGDGP